MTGSARQEDRRTRVLLVGGRSNAARSVREFFARETDYEVIVHTRSPSPALGTETVTVVDDYRHSLPADLDAVINFVGCVRGTAEMHQHVNVDLQPGIARAAKAAGARRFINISTLAVYGDVERIDHSTPEQPVTPYGISKLEGDRQLLAEVDDEFQVVILRVPTLYGDGMPGKIAALARLVCRVGVIPVPREPRKRSTLHVQNLANAICTLIDGKAAGVQFAADPELFTIDQLAGAMRSRCSRPVWTPVLPPRVLALMRRVAPGPIQSLYGESIIDPALVVVSPAYPPLRLGACLERAF